MVISQESFIQAYQNMRDMIGDGRIKLEDYHWTIKNIDGLLRLWPLSERIKIYKTLNGG